MGLQYDDTPSEEWMSAKIYAEYGIRLVNDYIRQNRTIDIPMPIARMFGRNLERAVDKLPEHMKEGMEFLTAQDGFAPALEPLLDTSNLSNGQLSGTLPVSTLAKALSVTKDLFCHAYAYSTYEDRFEMLQASNDTTDEGFVTEWDDQNYDCPEDDPEASITPWDEAKQEIYDENHGTASDYWKENEAEIFAKLFFGGAYSGHGGGSSSQKERVIKSEFALLTEPPK